MISLLFLSVALSLSSPAADVFADLPDVRQERYPVSGRTLGELRDAVERYGPVGNDGRRFHALTTWQYRYTYLHDGRGECVPRSAQVTVEVAVTLPELAGRTTLSAQARESWDQYVRRLAVHEREHVRLALIGRDRLERALRGARSCRDMVGTARRVQAEIDAGNADLDRRTGHGQRAPF